MTPEAEQEKKPAVSPELEAFQKELETKEAVEEKIRYALEFMRKTLSEGDSPRFKIFWGARTTCIPLFKVGVHPAIRAQLWQEFSELSKEARSLKDHLDKQSAFAIEQIQLAIDALEKEVESGETGSEPLALPLPSASLEARRSHYEPIQQELGSLNGWSQQINALRKELTQTSMRVRDRSRLFRRLSTLGDKIFPRRRDLVKKVSEDFIEDVDRFIQEHFNGGEPQGPLYQLRDEIKGLQAFAKVLTLNTHAFAQTRERLSECWNRVRDADKKRKKGMAQKRSASREVVQAIEGKVDAFLQSFEGGELATGAASGQLDVLSEELKALDLGAKDRRLLREKLGGARKAVAGKVKEAEREKRAASSARTAQLEEEIATLLLAQLDGIEEKFKALHQAIGSSEIFPSDREALELKLQPLSDRVVEAREASLLNGGKEGIETVLQERRRRRQAIKVELEALRKRKGGSGLDFEGAIKVDQQIHAEKERLEAIEKAIAELEQQLS